MTVSLLLPLITLASSLALRPLPARSPAASPAEATASGAQPAVQEPIDRVGAANAAAAPGVIEIRTAASSFNGDDGMPIVLMDPTRGESVGIWNSEGGDALRRLQKTEKGPFLWFRSEGHAFVIRDAALIERAEQILEPQSVLGRAQGELGGVQGELGGQQGRIGAEQGDHGRQIGELARREVRLQSRLHRHGLTASEERRIEAELDEVREARARAQAAMESLVSGQTAMAARQARLARRQAELTRRQAELSRALRRDLRALVGEALRDGRAIRLGSETY